MQRFFGMMPSSEVEIEKRYKDKCGDDVKIQAGKHGWTITWPDYSSTFKDVDDTAENNFAEAKAEAEKDGPLTENTTPIAVEVWEPADEI